MLDHSIVSQHFMEPEGSIPNSQDVKDAILSDSRVTDDGKVVSLTHRPLYSPETFFCFWYSFLLESE
jgi:hypothetical protein